MKEDLHLKKQLAELQKENDFLKSLLSVQMLITII